MSDRIGGPRDHLANERTQLAWLRTGATVMLVGLAIARFADDGEISAASLIAGGILVLTGAAGVCFGTLRYRRIARDLRRGEVESAAATFGPTLAAAVLLLAVVAACLLILTACSDGGGSDEKTDKDSTPTASTSASGGESAIDFEDSERKLPPEEVCQALAANDVGKVLGDKVKRGPVVQSTCTFADLLPQSERSVAISYLQLSAVGGIDAFEQGLGAAAEEVPDVGDKAFVLVTDGENGAHAVAAMATGDALIQLQVLPGFGVSVDDAKTVAVNLLHLVDARV